MRADTLTCREQDRSRPPTLQALTFTPCREVHPGRWQTAFSPGQSPAQPHLIATSREFADTGSEVLLLEVLMACLCYAARLCLVPQALDHPFQQVDTGLQAKLRRLSMTGLFNQSLQEHTSTTNIVCIVCIEQLGLREMYGRSKMATPAPRRIRSSSTPRTTYYSSSSLSGSGIPVALAQVQPGMLTLPW